tara:strand:+ start:3409 stop:3630 length:222 start_codon:yes stop_codon:yes gene_type:complete
MSELKVIILIITFTTTWVDFVLPMLKGKLDFKPFNCSFCLSFWLSILVVCFVQGCWLVLSTPLFLRIVERKLL